MITPLRPTTHAGFSRHGRPHRRRRPASPTVFSGTIFRLRPRLEVMEDRTLLSTFVVSNTGDSGPGSLRQAILDSNTPPERRTRSTSTSPGPGVQTIEPLTSLPAITNPVLIDGLSQPGYAGTPLIELSGSQAGSGDGLTDHRGERHRPRPGHQQFQPGRRHPHHRDRRHGRLDLRQLPRHRPDGHAGRA